MKNIDKYQLENFVEDLSFRKWVFGKTDVDDNFWQNWVNANPEKQALIEEAKSLVIASQIEEIDISENQIQEGIQAILFKTKPKTVRLYEQAWFKVAAIIIVMITLGWAINKTNKQSSTSEEVLSQATETENKSIQPLNMTLSDGTVVTLKKGSKLQVAPDFGQQTRTVYLTGDAFFEVKKDAQHPFLVIAGGVITKVLGTSFNVRAYANESNTLVSVQTGRVTVYKQEKSSDKNTRHPEQILLTPNQQVVFEREERKLVKTLVENPIILLNEKNNINFTFNETPIADVLTQLEVAYGVKFIFDKELLTHCNLTAVFGNEPLYDKIDIICETIQARYEIADGQIVIYAKGCK